MRAAALVALLLAGGPAASQSARPADIVPALREAADVYLRQTARTKTALVRQHAFLHCALDVLLRSDLPDEVLRRAAADLRANRATPEIEARDDLVAETERVCPTTGLPR